MAYKDDLYEKGLSGEKPGVFDEAFLDADELSAKRSGYRDHLRNRDLEERLSARETSESSSYESSSSSSSEGRSGPASLGDFGADLLVGLGGTGILSFLAYICLKDGLNFSGSPGDGARSFWGLVFLPVSLFALYGTVKILRRDLYELWTEKKWPET